MHLEVISMTFKYDNILSIFYALSVQSLSAVPFQFADQLEIF